MEEIVEIVGRAPGKIILCGEHAVVHGSAALAASLGLYTHVTIHKTSLTSSGLTLVLKDMNVSLTWSIQSLRDTFQNIESFAANPDVVKPCSPAVSSCLQSLLNDDDFPEAIIGASSGVMAFLFMYISIVGFKASTVTVSSELPLGSGLGSSAAFCVAISAATLALSGAMSLQSHEGDWKDPEEKKKNLINKWAFEGEKIIHGRPSGIDNTVSTFGDLVKFKSGTLTNIKQTFPIKMLITNTKVGRNTKALVAGVSERAVKHSKAMKAVFAAVDSISDEMEEIIQSPAIDDAIISEQQEKIEELMEMNQGLLQCMGVSHPVIEAVIQTTSKYKLHSKLTGAGGGGCVLTLLPKLLSTKVIDKLKADLEHQGFQCFSATIGGNGVQISSSSNP